MLKRAGSAVIFVAGSVIGGLALAFLVVALRPDLIRATPRPPEPATPAAERALPAPQRVTYAAAVQRAAPAVVNINTARLVTERLAPSLGELCSASSAASAPGSSWTRAVTSSRITMSSPTLIRSACSSRTGARRTRASWVAIRTPTSRC